MTKPINIIGIMSGTSVDGLDLAYCSFSGKHFAIIASKTFNYPNDLKKQLKNSMSLSATELFNLDAKLGFFIGKCVLQFLKATKLSKPYAIASHGHTVFHQPENYFTVQIGKGSHIASVCNIPVVCDFRSNDIAYGGHGAPLVPIGDKLLFSQYDYCLNLGGIANISYQQKNKRIAFDIAPCNLPVNIIMNKMGFDYDENGQYGKAGKINNQLLENLNSLNYYKLKSPKSLGREFIETQILPLLNNINTRDAIRTYYEHIALQISKSVIGKSKTVLVTGGGAYNRFLMQLISSKTNAVIITPDNQLIEFKEALIFAYLGYLRILHKPNSLKSVTGAIKDAIGGCIYLP